MKPIHLKITGLNSFRETQEIDFETLSETGAFGIFGPTGSGKSSILDAITLAMYGKVERAENNTQGILNHAEDRLKVSFMFSLGTDANRNKYLVERQYKRASASNVNSGPCRLVEINDHGENVLADKSTEVTKKISAILGMEFDDFTRAVVLPQGKFSEFLKLKGKERRVMLERIFGLEEYGDKLNAKLGIHASTVKTELESVLAFQMGLGDASQESINVAEEDLKRCQKAKDASQKALSDLQKEFEQDKEVWQLQQQLIAINKQQEELTHKTEEIKILNDKFVKAEKAEKLRSLLEEVATLEIQLKDFEEDLRRRSENLKLAKKNADEAEIRHTEVNLKRVEIEPKLHLHIERLEQAQETEKMIHEREKALGKIRDDYKNLLKEKTEFDKNLSELLEEKSTLTKKLQDEKDRLQQISVTPEFRKKLSASVIAYQAFRTVMEQNEYKKEKLNACKKEITQLQAQLTHADELFDKQKAYLDACKTQLEELQNNAPLSEQQLTELVQETEKLASLLENINRAEKDVEIEEQKANHYKQAYEQVNNEASALNDANTLAETNYRSALAVKEHISAQAKQIEQREMAGLLSKDLVEGKRCPVCGSDNHPQPATILDSDMLQGIQEELAQADQQLQKCIEERNGCITLLAVVTEKCNNLRHNLHNQSNLIIEKINMVKNYRTKLSEQDRELPLEQLQIQLTLNLDAVSESRIALEKWKNACEKAVEELAKAQSAQDDAKEMQAKLVASYSAAERAVKDTKSDLEKSLNELETKNQELRIARGEIKEDEILVLDRQIAERDQQAEEISQSINQLEATIKQIEQAYETLKQAVINTDLMLKEKETVGKQEAAEIKSMDDKLQAITQGASVAELLKGAKQELTELIDTSEARKKTYEAAREFYQQAQQKYTTANEKLALLSGTFKDKKGLLAIGLLKEEFFTTEEAKDALCTDEERKNMQQEITQHNESLSLLKNRHEQLSKELDGREVLEDVWLGWQEKLNYAQAEFNKTVEAVGAAQRALSELTKNHAKWLEAEEKHQRLSKLSQQLNLLKRTFQGKTFVEFIAEEQLRGVALDASARLAKLTNHRYALELSSDSSFVMRDDANGGYRRPVNTLSGGETFLTSLALALALSSQIQLRGDCPLEFFFLDEGFGTLDPTLLEIVMNTLERLHMENLTIGIISHVPELKNRIARRLVVMPGEPGGKGTTLKIESA